jgi:tight adherence protein B
MSPVVVLVASVFVAGTALAMGLMLLAGKLPGHLAQRRLLTRLGELNRPDAGGGEDADGLVKEKHAGPLPVLDRLAGGTSRGVSLNRWLEQSGARITVSGLLLIALGSAFLCGFLGAVLSKMPVGWVVGGAIGFMLPFVVIKIKRTRRMRKYEEMFPDALDLISRALKAGHAFATGLKMVADEMPDPVGPEFRKTFDEQNFGLPLKDALANLTERMPLLDVRFFSTAVLIQRETGGNLSEILENLAHVVRERFKILRQVRVYTAHGRLTGYVLLALPAFLGIALMFINPEHMQLLFREKIGHMLLMAALVMQTIGYFWIKQVIKIEV